MNTAQKIVLTLAAIGALGIYIYPPWMEHYTDETGGYPQRELGHHLVWKEPVALLSPTTHGARVWSARRSQYFFALGGVAFVLYVVAGRTSRTQAPDAPERGGG